MGDWKQLRNALLAKSRLGSVLRAVHGMMPKATADSGAANRPISDTPAPGATLSLIGIVACEVTTSLLVALCRKPALGMVFVGLGMAIALGWLRRYRRHADAVVSDRIDTATRLLAEGHHLAAWNTACAAADAAAGPRLRNAALTVMARIALDDRRYQTARQALGRVRPRWAADLCLEAAIARADAGVDEAIETLERARSWPTFDGAAARLLIELCGEANHLEQAARIAIAHLDLLEVHDVRHMIASLAEWGEPHHAAAVTMALTIRLSGADRQIRLSESHDGSTS
jgi:hypothetical protein